VQISSKQLRDDLMTMLIAGHETTAAVLTWTLHCLASRPDVVARLQAEARAHPPRRPAPLRRLIRCGVAAVPGAPAPRSRPRRPPCREGRALRHGRCPAACTAGASPTRVRRRAAKGPPAGG